MRQALWLIPAEPARSRLAALIADLAREHAAPRFDPHVTLLAGLESEGPERGRRGAALARAFGPFQATLTQVDRLPEYYRALFLAVEGPGLAAAHARAAAAMGVPPDPAYRPHLSLLYADLGTEAKEAIVNRIGRRWDEQTRLDRLDLVRTEGGVESWARLSSWPLGGG